jgi:hypothetical protein
MYDLVLGNIYKILVWILGALVGIIILVGKTYLEQISKLQAQDWYANYRGKRR